MRSFTYIALWVVFRHRVVLLLYRFGGTPIWNQAGIWHFSAFDIFLGAKVRLCFLAIWRRAIRGLGTCLPSRFVLPDGLSVVRKVCISCCSVIPSLLMQLMIVSSTKAHNGRLGDLSVYVLSHVSSMAWFRASMSSRLIPPSVHGFINCCSPRPGGGLPLSHMKSRVIVVMAFKMVGGILCAFVRNCVMPPTIICIIRRFASRVGLDLLHLSRDAFMLSRAGDHVCAPSTLFPIHAPSICVGFPSSAIFIPGVRGGSSG